MSAHAHHHHHAKESAALWSVLASGLLAAGKFAVGLFSGSLALLSEAAHSLADTVSTIVTWLAVRWSGKPADEDHQYGHGKIESVAALIETGVLFALALGVLAQAGRRLFFSAPQTPQVTPLVLGVVLISIAIDINRIRVLRRVAQATGSQALAADALHFTSDLAGSVTVLLGLLAARLGFVYGDTVAALCVAGFIGVAGWQLGRRTLDTLLDAAPTGRTQRLRELALKAPGVVAVESVRVRSDGSKVFGEMVLAVSRALTLIEVSALKERVCSHIASEFPDTELIITAQPRVLDSETVRERVLLSGQRHHLPLHHVTVQEVSGTLSISFDMEVDGKATLAEAHTSAEEFKRILREEFGSATEVEPHMEPLDAAPLSGKDADPALVERIAEELQRGAEHSMLIREIHDVRVRTTAAGWVVNYHCRALGHLTIEAVHRDMDAIEHSVRCLCPEIVRIVGHADVHGEQG
ncbi:MAG: cation-efflux pump [Puniceicoccales bacterium]|jgi:cation diffusion facilitator family transporter|nr:cation-efflux pump [Puniceicoccales bacterium]